MYKPIVFILWFLLTASGLILAGQSDSGTDKKAVLYEKVYLHVDRELYSPGDIVWFKSYLVGGISHQLIPGYKNIYVQLIAEDGSVVDQKLLLSDNGTARGDFLLSDSLDGGSYILRAYTKYLENFGQESFYHRKIFVARAKSSLELQHTVAGEAPAAIDVSFLPEGGSFVLNTINHIAFKAIDETGKGIPVKGKVVDETGREVVFFQSRYRGMGKFVMMPQEGKDYFVLIDDHPEFHYRFEPARPDGISLNYKADGNYLLFTLSRNIKMNGSKEYKLAASHKGVDLFVSHIKMSDFQYALRLYKGLFPLGISKVTLLDAQNRKVVERLVFVKNRNDRNIQIRMDKTEYESRDKVRINLASLLPENDTVLSTVSVAVVHEDYFSSTGMNQTIESFLLLDSELKGSVESSASCFIDDVDITSEEKLDLIMLVNGWRSYYWNDLEKYAGVELPGWADIGLTLEGTVTRTWGGKPVEDGKVVLGPFSRNFLFEQTETDENGSYRFDKLYLKDSALVMINAETKKGRKGTEITMEQNLDFKTNIPPGKWEGVADIDVPMMFYRDIYYSRRTEEEYESQAGTIMLDEITIEGKRGESDGHFRLYQEADQSFTITESDWTYATVLDYLQGKAPGVVITGDEVRIRSASRNPLLLVDGLRNDWEEITNIPMGDIDKIEILKTGFSSAVYGSEGGDGIIAVYTRMGKGEWESNYVRHVRGRITPRVGGFQQPREFYAPKYTLENRNDPQPDLRATLCWKPEVSLTGGEAAIEFYTADKLARYQVVVEGISKKGKIIFGTNLLTVSVPR